MNDHAFALSITDLWKTYAGKPVVKGVSLNISPGEVFGLLGPNGAGKSTTINIISGVARRERGTVSVFGYDNQIDFKRTRRLVGVMHQEVVIDPFFSVGQALKMHSGYYGVEDDPAWREMLIERLALGPHVHKVMNRLSGGMKRRFMVAKALIHKPKLLILDEPTAGVDVELRLALWDLVREINASGTTVLLTTHYLEEAEEMCGRVAIMNLGEIVALDSTRRLLERLERKKLLIRLQSPLLALPQDLSGLSVEVMESGRLLQFHLSDDHEVAKIFSSLARAQAAIEQVETMAPSLEDIFLKLTGRANGNTERGE